MPPLSVGNGTGCIAPSPICSTTELTVTCNLKTTFDTHAREASEFQVKLHLEVTDTSQVMTVIFMIFREWIGEAKYS